MMLIAARLSRIIKGYKSVIKTVCRLRCQNMSEDNTAKASTAKNKLSRQKTVTEYCTRAVQQMANINNLHVDSDRYQIPSAG